MFCLLNYWDKTLRRDADFLRLDDLESARPSEVVTLVTDLQLEELDEVVHQVTLVLLVCRGLDDLDGF
jgi:hypothetical protein